MRHDLVEREPFQPQRFAKGKVAVRPKTFDTKKTMAGLLVLEKLKE